MAGRWRWQSFQNRDRAEILSRLRSRPGGQIVIVHYSVDRRISNFCRVYNRADLNSAKVVWAHDLGPAENQELVDYFKGRHAWLVDADDPPPKLEPYPEGASSDSAAERQASPQGQ